MEEQNQVEAVTQKETRMKWLPFGLSWKKAWLFSIIAMPILCLLVLTEIGILIFASFLDWKMPPLVQAICVFVSIILWLVVVIHTVVDIMTMLRWAGDDLFHLVVILGCVMGGCLLFGLPSLSDPKTYGMAFFFLLVALAIITFIDIWALNHMREESAR